MIKNSFLIATNRTYSTHAQPIVNQLESYGALDDGEIIICCPFKIFDSSPSQLDTRVKCIEDLKQQNGNVAFNEAARNSVGEYIYILCDDHYLTNGIISGDRFFNSMIFQDKKYKIASMSSQAPCHIGPIPNFPETNFITRNVMCRFPFFNREMYVKHLNEHVFHPSFNICSHFADNYLSYFLAINEEPTIECDFIQLRQMENTDQFDDGSVEPFGGTENKYPTGYLDSLSIYINLCKNLKKNDPHVGKDFLE
tara:strand:+ start:249 stop:1007 length:759 start_codon:yes stop_codon:yes gene_type:complete